MEEIHKTHHPRNPGMIRFPCKYQQTMVSHGFNLVQDFVHPQDVGNIYPMYIMYIYPHGLACRFYYIPSSLQMGQMYIPTWIVWVCVAGIVEGKPQGKLRPGPSNHQLFKGQPPTILKHTHTPIFSYTLPQTIEADDRSWEIYLYIHFHDCCRESMSPLDIIPKESSVGREQPQLLSQTPGNSAGSRPNHDANQRAGRLMPVEFSRGGFLDSRANSSTHSFHSSKS